VRGSAAPVPVAEPPRRLVLRDPGDRVSATVRVRTLAVMSVVALAIAVLGVMSLAMGSYDVPLPDLFAALTGGADRATTMVVVEWRLPRAVTAVAFGAALGTSGAVFQSLTRNPLGSPDVIGFDSGSATGALTVILLVGVTPAGITAGALAGGLAAAAVVYALAFRHGIAGARFVVVGIAVSAMLIAVNQWLMLRADLDEGMAAAAWTLGSLADIGWSRLAFSLPLVAALLVAVGALSHRIRVLELRDDVARSLGVDVGRTRALMVLAGVSLVAVPTAVAGPIAFVALAAPHLARRLCRTPGLAIAPSAALGALVLLGADVAVQRLPTPSALPVGVATLSLGGAYLLWLLATEARVPR
jgi:iron complex transport system permease protein